VLQKPLSRCQEILAGDHTILREMLHPVRDPAAIGYSLAHVRIPVGATSLPHRLQTSEVYYFISGQGRMYIDHEKSVVGPEQAVYVPPGAIQYVENTGKEELIFLCIVDPAWRVEDEDVLDNNH
jgi:mannose-6-phosphate isomerase-like protein (cupin superfamily)